MKWNSDGWELELAVLKNIGEIGESNVEHLLAKWNYPSRQILIYKIDIENHFRLQESPSCFFTQKCY